MSKPLVAWGLVVSFMVLAAPIIVQAQVAKIYFQRRVGSPFNPNNIWRTDPVPMGLEENITCDTIYNTNPSILYPGTWV